MKPKKLPAYGRQLKRQRDSGQHPDRVWVLCGDDWGRRPRNEVSLCVEAGYRVGTYDWSLVAGVPVHVVERGDVDAVRLAAEIARFATSVTIHWRAGPDEVFCQAGRARQEDISDIAWCQRQQVDGVLRWPDWWSDTLESEYRARRKAWHRALVEDLVQQHEQVAV